jgi:hypothetical protein
VFDKVPLPDTDPHPLILLEPDTLPLPLTLLDILSEELATGLHVLLYVYPVPSALTLTVALGAAVTLDECVSAAVL